MKLEIMGKKILYKRTYGAHGTLGEHGTDHPNKYILKYGKMVTSRIVQKIDGHSPDYYGPAALMTEEMAKIGLKMKRRKPKTLDEIAELEHAHASDYQMLSLLCNDPDIIAEGVRYFRISCFS